MNTIYFEVYTLKHDGISSVEREVAARNVPKHCVFLCFFLLLRGQASEMLAEEAYLPN